VADLLVESLREVQRRLGASNLCLAGGLFYNTSINTRILESRVFDRVFIPVHPGNPGLAIGCALAVSPQRSLQPAENVVPPFFGPEYEPADIKAVLDNCKLSYEYEHEDRVIERTIEALCRGDLVGWFQGRMEWGPRALGNRSILASPFAPYVLENLNTFLKHRESYRSYAVS